MYRSLLLFLLILALTVYTALRPGVLSPLGMTFWALVVINTITITHVTNNRWSSTDYVLIICFALVLFLHSSYSTDPLVSLLMYMANFVILIGLRHYLFNPVPILYISCVGVVIQAMLYFSSLLIALGSSDVSGAMLGFFQNSNTTSAYAMLGYISAYCLFREQTKIRLFFMLICLLSVFASMSRNVLLTIFLFHVVLYFYKYRWFVKILPWVSAMMISMLVLFVNNFGESLTLFGKEGLTGRLDHMLFLSNAFDITFIGHGRNYISDLNQYYFLVPPHNMYYYTLYGMGLFYLIIYIYFIFYMFYSLKSKYAKAFLFGLQFYFFFEPVIPFESSMSFMLAYVSIFSIDILATSKETSLCQEQSYTIK